ncbi:MAG: dihydrodipicolinate synthase family protein [Rhodospirillales bacterium]|nr:dihydrodipicolinate synthase family protein [Rhodospirillales bacterium]HJO72732.1 dihydrodipicolinate synthase family protein [Rhodospirillales bacterium]
MNEAVLKDREMDEACSLKGVFSAVLTPQTADLAPDHGALADHSRWLLANGCDGLAFLGTTGEANSFSVGERADMLEALVEAGIPAAKLLPGTGCCAAPDTVHLTRHALEMGTAGVLVLPPFYYKNVSDDGVFAAFARIIEEVGDAALRVYVYHFPQMSAVPISHAVIERLLKRYPGVVAGMKDSSGDLDNMTSVARAFPQFSVFSGWDQLMLPLLEEGGAGCITAVANVASYLSAKVYAGWREGDVEDAQELLTRVRVIISSSSQLAALKAIMARHTGEGGWENMRPPLVALDDGQRSQLFAELDATGFSPPPVS